jgi:hypothetical protein
MSLWVWVAVIAGVLAALLLLFVVVGTRVAGGLPSAKRPNAYGRKQRRN